MKQFSLVIMIYIVEFTFSGLFFRTSNFKSQYNFVVELQKRVVFQGLVCIYLNFWVHKQTFRKHAPAYLQKFLQEYLSNRLPEEMSPASFICFAYHSLQEPIVYQAHFYFTVKIIIAQRYTFISQHSMKCWRWLLPWLFTA